MTRGTRAVLALGTFVVLVAGACTDNSDRSGDGDGDGALTVSSTDDACEVSSAEAPSGNLQFSVKNDGSQVTEFYLLAEDGLRIIGEIENIGPGLTRPLVVTAAPGRYVTACKPGMVGDGIRADFTVNDSGADLAPSDDIAALVDTATAQYASYVRDQTEQLLTDTQAFAAAYTAGDDDAARSQYAETRLHWERIEPVAESFGDLDPRLDLREADLEAGQEWTGWHRIEKDLWPEGDPSYTAATPEERAALAAQLVADTQELYDRTRDLTYTADQLGNGAKALLDEVATGKVTGEEEAWSHTDLWDFQANVDGARIAFEDLRPALEVKDPDLATLLDERFAALQALLDEQREGDGFVLYTELSDEQVKALSDSVNALSEPLSQLTAAVVL
jgi:iron uptake system component EfeO